MRRLSLGLCMETSGRSSVSGSWGTLPALGDTLPPTPTPANSSCQAGLDSGKPSSIQKQLSTSLLSPVPLYWGLVTLRPWAAGHSPLCALTLSEGRLVRP